MLQFTMFGMYTKFRKFLMEKAVNLQTGLFLKMTEKILSQGRLLGNRKLILQKTNGNII